MPRSQPAPQLPDSSAEISERVAVREESGVCVFVRFRDYLSEVMLSRSEGGNACYLVLRRVSEQDSAHHQRSPALAFFVCASIRWPGEVCHVVRNEKRELCVCGARRFSSSSPCVVSVISRFVSVPTNSRVSFFWRPSRRSSLLPAPWTLRGGYLFHHLSASMVYK